MNYSSIHLNRDYCNIGVLLLAASQAEINVEQAIKELKFDFERIEIALKVKIPTFDQQMEKVRAAGTWKPMPSMAETDAAHEAGEELDFENCYTNLTPMQKLVNVIYLINILDSFIGNYEEALKLEGSIAQDFLNHCADNAVESILTASQVLDSRIEEYAPRLDIMEAIRPMMVDLNSILTTYGISKVYGISGIDGVSILVVAVNDLRDNLLYLCNNYLMGYNSYTY